MSKQTITINGIAYDAQTGLPVETTAAPMSAPVSFTPRKQVRPSQSVHTKVSKSQTLNRRTVKKSPVAPLSQTATQSRPTIAKFAPHPAGAKRAVKMMDFSPSKRPAATSKTPHVMPAKKASRVIMPPASQTVAAPVSMEPASVPMTVATSAVPAAPMIKPSQVLKQEAIDKALATPAAKETKRQTAKREKLAKKQKRSSRIMSIASASFALLLLGGYFTYLNMPSLSVRVAAAQAGVSASYPGYKPDGYSINGLVTYSPGTVSMNFTANGSSRGYTIEQSQKNWDSSAVLENYVKPKAGESYIPYSERGLTIYTFENNAAWVNNGILYTINGNAPLSSDQIRQIATSM